MRLSKLFSELNISSRSETEDWIAHHWIRIHGRTLTEPKEPISPKSLILIDKKALEKKSKSFTIAINKPPGFVSGFKDPKHKHAMALIQEKNFKGNNYSRPNNLSSFGVVGRLDSDSRGLLIYTQDGVFAKSIIGPESQVEKEYIVKVRGKITDSKIKSLTYGLKLDDQLLKKAHVEKINPQTLRFILTQGRKRQIRRMCQLLDLEAIDLKRIRIGDYRLHSTKGLDLKEGQWTFL